jgi:hypothetical protein
MQNNRLIEPTFKAFIQIYLCSNVEYLNHDSIGTYLGYIVGEIATNPLTFFNFNPTNLLKIIQNGPVSTSRQYTRIGPHCMDVFR